MQEKVHFFPTKTDFCNEQKKFYNLKNKIHRKRRPVPTIFTKRQLVGLERYPRRKPHLETDEGEKQMDCVKEVAS